MTSIPERTLAYITFDPGVAHANCEECGVEIPVELTVCDDCSGYSPEEEPDHDDSVKFCPDCERPNQFGELCQSCQSDRDAQEYADTHEATDVRCVW
jgi:hypothetical protein